MYALTRIKGVGRRYSNLVCKKADVDLNKRYARPAQPRSHPARLPPLAGGLFVRARPIAHSRN